MVVVVRLSVHVHLYLGLSPRVPGQRPSVCSISLCGGGVRSILLLPFVARCLETIDVCI